MGVNGRRDKQKSSLSGMDSPQRKKLLRLSVSQSDGHVTWNGHSLRSWSHGAMRCSPGGSTVGFVSVQTVLALAIWSAANVCVAAPHGAAGRAKTSAVSSTQSVPAAAESGTPDRSTESGEMLQGSRGQRFTADNFSTSAASDGDQRRAILNSREWLSARHAFNAWLSVQEIYSTDEVRKIRQTLNSRLKAMSAEQLREFVADLSDKMTLYTSARAEDDRQWLTRRVSVGVHPAEEDRQALHPDLYRLTAGQLEEHLRGIEARRMRLQQVQQNFDVSRERRIAAYHQARQDQDRGREQNMGRAVEGQLGGLGTGARAGVENGNPGLVPDRDPFLDPYDPSYNGIGVR